MGVAQARRHGLPVGQQRLLPRWQIGGWHMMNGL